MSSEVVIERVKAKKFTQKKLKQWQFLVVIWLHITLLDLFYITPRGIVFLWHDNGQLKTLATHAFIALLTFSFYLLVNKLPLKKNAK
jgi:hypothetical protein